MSKALVGTLIALFALAVIAGSLFAQYVGAYNYGVATEAAIEASYKDNQNIKSKYTTMIREMVQVPDMYRADLEKVVAADLEGRYGENGSSATFQWIQERQLPFDSSLYARLQTAIEAGRSEFANGQTRLLDQLRSYEQQRGYFWRGTLLEIAGFPKKDLSQFKILVDSEVTQQFEAGEDSAMQLRSKE